MILKINFGLIVLVIFGLVYHVQPVISEPSFLNTTKSGSSEVEKTETIEVVYMSSKILQLTVGSRDSSQAEKKIMYLLLLKFIYSEKATKYCEIFTLLLTGTTKDKSKVKILQNFVAFSEYINFTTPLLGLA